MDDLAQWLRAQLDEDERIAREAPPGPWYIGGAVDPTKPCQVNTFPELRLIADGLNWLVAEHIAAHNPARVLREIDSKRQLLDQYARAMENRRAHRPDLASAGALLALHGAVKVLALPYVDKPGYAEAVASFK